MKKKILILASNPKDTNQLKLLEEMDIVREAIRRSQNRERFSIYREILKTKSDLRRHILDVKPQIVHFCGHGEKGGLVLEDEQGRVKLAENEFIADFLKNYADRIECVLLNACDTEPLANKLVKHLNYVIGMTQPVGDDAAIAFTEGFYDTLGAGESIERAFEIGKNAVLGRVSTHDAEQRKLTAIDEDGNPIEIENLEHLIPVLKQNPQPTLIRQIWLSPEQERKAVRELLAAIEDYSNKIPLFHTTELIILKDQYIPVQVTLERRYQHTVETTWGYAESEAELRRIYALKGSTDEEIKPQQVDWQEAKRQESRIVVLADPGMGKSTLLRMEVCNTVEQSYQALENGQPMSAISIPLYIKLSRLADDEIRNMPILEAILEIIQERHSHLLKHNQNADIQASLNVFLKEQLFSGKCLLLLDALDEVSQDQRHQLLARLDEFARAYPSCKIIGSSRIVGYGGKLVDGAKDMEIVPFTQQQTEQYIETWFTNAQNSLKDKSVTARGLIQALRDRPQISGLAQNPLLLSLICSLYQRDKLTLPARRGQIYQQSVDYILDEWSHDNQRLSSDAAQIDTKKELLEELAYQFSCQETDVFSMRQLRHKIKDYLRHDNATDLDNKTNRLIEELSEQDGILQKLNPDEDRYVFLHRTFQEYFTASYLNHMIEDDRTEGIALVQQYFWNYDWHETLSLLAGLMDQPMVLIEAILSTRDDIFNTQLLLAGRCVAESSKLSEPLINETIDRIYQFWLKYPNFEFISSVVVAIAQTYAQLVQNLKTALQHENLAVVKNVVYALGNIGNDWAVDALIPALNYKSAYIRKHAAKALGNIVNDKAVDSLIVALNNDIDNEVRGSAAKALGNIGNQIAVDHLINALNHDQDAYVRRFVSEALGNIGNDKAVNSLIIALNNRDAYIRKLAAKALGSIGNNKAIDSLIVALNNDIDNEVRGSAAKALGNIGNQVAVDHLINALNHDQDAYVRRFVSEALGNIDGKDKVNILVHDLIVAFKDTNSSVQINATKALEKIGNVIIALKDANSLIRMNAVKALEEIGYHEKVIDLLIKALKHKDSFVRNNIAEALMLIVDDKVVNLLIVALNDKDANVRRFASEALGNIGNDTAVDSLIVALNDDISEVRDSAAKALGNIGNHKAVNPLIIALNDRNTNVRLNAAKALGNIANDTAVDPLIVFLNDENHFLKINVLEALGKIGTLNCLKQLIQSSDIDIRNSNIFPLARKLAIKHSQYGSPLIPVYPELV